LRINFIWVPAEASLNLFREARMESKPVVKHILLGKFKQDITPGRIEDLINGYANLVNLIEPMKSFEWGEDVSVENLQGGFTHVFESTFDSLEGRDAYISHPVHVEYANELLSALEKILVIDYKPSRII